MDGFFIVNKPKGPTSFTVVKRIRALCNGARTGHAGTLDPAASGLLIVAVGSATRLLEYLPLEPKRYEFTLCFGIETDTLDDEGSVIREDGLVPSVQDIQAVLPRFIGPLMQEPPRFSAIKIKGQRAYTRARNDESFTLRPRSITIQSLTLIDPPFSGNQARFEVSCSTGTYVRALARDIALALNTRGHARNIMRVAAGPFSLSQAVDFSMLAAPMDALCIPVRTMIARCASTVLAPAQVRRVIQGADIALSLQHEPNWPLFAFNESGDLVAVLTKNNGETFHPAKVFLRHETYNQ
ncbi:MAG TPA: tRNA pseudouridine(55) synthase TruB [Chitinivibrionales bacterium]